MIVNLRNALLLIGFLLISGALVFSIFPRGDGKSTSGKSEVTKERLQEVEKRLTIGGFVVTEKDSTVLKVIDSERSPSKQIWQLEEISGITSFAETHEIAGVAILVIPRHSTEIADFQDRTMYKRACVVFNDPEYVNYFQVDVH